MLDQYTLAVNIFEEFLKFNPALIKLMRNTEQAYDGLNPLKYHLENDVWTHTCLCFNHFLNTNNIKYRNTDFLISIVVSILCHDIGKCYTKKIDHEKKKTSFNSHGYASIQDTINFIDHLYNKGFITCRDYVLNLVLPAVANHLDLYRSPKNIGLFFNCNNELKDLSSVLAECDSRGSITHAFSKKKDGVDFYNIEMDNNKKYDKSLRNIYIYCGLPGSGKDYCAEQMGLPIVSFDNIRIEEYKKSHKKEYYNNLTSSELYNEAWTYCNTMKIDLFKIMKQQTDNIKGDVIICNTNCNKKVRKRIVHSMGKANYHCVYIVSNINNIIDRDNNRDSKNVGQSVITNFMYNQQIPTLRENFVSVNIKYN